MAWKHFPSACWFGLMRCIALHARSRCKEFDQVSAEMSSKIEDLQRLHPDAQVAEAYSRGYQRGRDYYQQLCDESNAA